MFNPAVFFVKRWQFTLLIFALLASIGILSFKSIPRAEDPHFPVPVVVVAVAAPGMDALEIERLITDKVEEVIDGLDNLHELKSFSKDGLASVTAQFTWDSDAERKYDQVVREVNAIRPNLPSGIADINILRFRTTNAAFMQIALTSPSLPWRRLEKVADDLRLEIKRQPGVRQVEMWGAPRSEVQVAIRSDRLTELRISPLAIAKALQNRGADSPIGVVHAGTRRFNVKAEGSFSNLNQVANTPVASSQGRVVYVRDVADVSWGTAEPRHLTQYNGQRSMFITVQQKDNIDVIRLTDSLQKRLDDFEHVLPADVTMVRAFVQAENVKRRLNILFRDFGVAVSLVLLTILPLGFRASCIVAISIPLSLLIGLSMMHMIGFSLNQLSIAGFVLSLGLLVDDSIVVTENIARHMRRGERRKAAAISATGEIAVAVLGCTMTLLFAVLPIMFLPEGAGKFVRALAYAIYFTILASFFVSLTIIPFLASRLLPEEKAEEGNKLLQWVNAGIHGIYRPVLKYALDKPRRCVFIIMALCLTSIPMVKVVGVSLFPPSGIPQFLIQVELPEGASFQRTGEVMKKIEGTLDTMRDRALGVDWVMSNVGHGNPQIFYNKPMKRARSNYGELFVQLRGWSEKKSHALLDELRTEFTKIAGARITIVTFTNGPPIDAPISIRVSGHDLDSLRSLSFAIVQQMEQTPGVRDIDNPVRISRTDLNLNVDESKAATLGIPAGSVHQMAAIALSGIPVSRFRDSDGDDYPVTLRLPLSERHELEALREIYLPTERGVAPLSQVTNPHFTSKIPSIDRYNRLRTVTINAYTSTGFLVSKVTNDLFARLDENIKLPPGYFISAGGQAEAQSRNFSGMGSAALLGFFGILMVLILEFGKFRIAMIVLGVIPLGLFGGIYGLLVTGYSLSFIATIGLIALMGIEIKSSILLVDFAERRRERGATLKEAIMEAGEVRFLPVLLTSVTAIFGLMPLALAGSGLFSPLAIVIIGGLITSTFLSRIAIPALYLILARGDSNERSCEQQS